MRMRVQGRSMRFADSQQIFEEVRDSGEEFGAENPEPASTAEICKMTPEQYRSWRETGRKPVADDETQQEFEPVADCKAAEEFSRASDRKNGIDNGRPSEAVMDSLSPIDRFTTASDARNRLNPRYQADARRRRSE